MEFPGHALHVAEAHRAVARAAVGLHLLDECTRLWLVWLRVEEIEPDRLEAVGGAHVLIMRSSGLDVKQFLPPIVNSLVLSHNPPG